MDQIEENPPRPSGREEGIGDVCEIIADCLALDPDEVSVDSALVTDLGADSLDFLDLLFSLEKKFSIKIREGELEFLSKFDFASSEAVEDGVLTKESIDKLDPWLPGMKQIEDKGSITPAMIVSLITVETLWLMVESKLPA